MVFWIVSVILLLWSPLSQAATSRPTSQPSSLRCKGVPYRDLLRTPAAQVLAGSGRVAVLYNQKKNIAMYRASDGKRIWSKQLQKKPTGVHSMHNAGAYIVVYAGNRLFSFVARNGSFAGQRWVRLHQHIRHPSGCTFVHRRGVCAYSCGDEFKLLSCQTMYPMSATYSLTQTCFSKRGCFSFRGKVFGAVGSLMLASVEEPKRTSGKAKGPRRRQVVLAVHRKTGQVVWESEHDAVVVWMFRESGLSPDQKTCWMANYAGDLSVFDCKSGKELWVRGRTTQTSPLTLLHRMVRWHSKPRGFFIQERGRIALVRARTGKVIWQKSLSPQTFALVRGGTGPRVSKTLKKALTFRRVSPQRGALLHEFTVPAGRRVWAFPEGEVLVEFSGLLRLYRSQKSIPLGTFRDIVSVRRSANFWVVRTKRKLIVVGHSSGKVLLSLSGVWKVSGLEKELGPGRLLLQRSGQVRLVELCLPSK